MSNNGVSKSLASVVRGMLSESNAQQIDELSKKTLASYAKKAIAGQSIEDKKAKAFSDMAHDDALRGDPESAQDLAKRAVKHITRSANRRVGVVKAIDKLATEEVKIEESFVKGDRVSYQKNRNERGSAIVSSKSTAKKNHYYIKTSEGNTVLVPHYELVKESEENHQISEATAHEKVVGHPSVESVDNGGKGEYFVNLKKGYHWSGQRSFGVDSPTHALKMLKDVKNGDENGIDVDRAHEEYNHVGEQIGENFADGYYVTRDSTLTHTEPFKDSNYAIRHANKKEDETGRVHTVHHVKGGKIAKQWQYSDSRGQYAPYTDYKGDTFSPKKLNEQNNEDKMSKEFQMLDESVKNEHLKPGDKVVAGYRRAHDHRWNATFKGYTDHTDPYSHSPKFNSLKEVHAHYGTKNLSELEHHPEGGKVHQLFHAHEKTGDDPYHTYLFKGRWAVGTSGDKHLLHQRGHSDSVHEEVGQIDELSNKTLASYVKGASNHRTKLASKLRTLQTARSAVDDAQGHLNDQEAANTLRNQFRKEIVKTDDKDYNRRYGISKALNRLAKEEVDLTEGKMTLDKVNIVHHHDEPAAKEFAKMYTAGNKGDFRQSGSTEADEKASEMFHTRFRRVSGRSGFAGSGHDVYKDTKTGGHWIVHRHPNGKTFYGTDHIISPHSGNLGEEVEEVNELSTNTMSKYILASSNNRTKATSDKQWKKRDKGISTAVKKILHKEEAVTESESPIAGTRLVSKHEGQDGHHAEVRYNPEWEEYQVHHYNNGKHLGEGPVSYHGSGKEGKADATETAKYEVKNFRVKNGKLHNIKTVKRSNHGYESGQDEKVNEELEESIGTKTKSFNDFKDLAHELADHITPDGKVKFNTRKVGVGGKTWHQTQSIIHNMRDGKSYSYGVFNHDKEGSDSGHGHHLHPCELDEEVENLEELSKETLVSYIVKSINSAKLNRDHAKDNHRRAERAASYANTDDDIERGEKLYSRALKQSHTAKKRQDGFELAAQKLKEDVEQIDELSNTTLARYIVKASKAKVKASTFDKRLDGMKNAGKKISDKKKG